MYLEYNFTVIICHRYETVINVKLSYSIIIYRHANFIKKITEQVRYSIATHVLCPLPNINANFRQVIFACKSFQLVKQMSSFLVYIIILHIIYKKCHVLNNNNVSFQTNVHIQYKNFKNTYINNNSTKKK